MTRRLVQEFAGHIGLDVIEDAIRAAARGHADAPITTYVPILVERNVRARLRTIAAGSEDA